MKIKFMSLLFFISATIFAQKPESTGTTVIAANNPLIEYTGRIDYLFTLYLHLKIARDLGNAFIYEIQQHGKAI